MTGLLGLSGYMGLGYAFYPPLFASICLIAAAIGMGVRIRRKGDAWLLGDREANLDRRDASPSAPSDLRG